ncbi:MAG: glutaredoxin 3 [Gammaproteobacteria bacterium]|nr:glutaredoxin 3 [Gammaproteobacteria bacterium]
MARVIVYYTPSCPYCMRARQLFDAKGVNYEGIRVDTDPALRREMQQKSGRYTVPQIFINQQAIGGCDELYDLEAQGELDNMLAANTPN